MTTKTLIKKALAKTYFLMWLSPSFWRYLLNKDKANNYCSKRHRFWCRAAGHPSGPWYHNMGHEPDWQCKECGDYLA